MKPAIFTLPLILISSAAFALSPQQAVEKAYPRVQTKLHCRIAIDNYKNTYCMKLKTEKIVDTSQGKMLYQLYTGYAINLKDLTPNDVHVVNGLAGIFVSKQTPNGWNVIAQSAKQGVGSFGTPPDTWQFTQLGNNIWGFITEHGDMHQGYEGSHYVIFMPNRNKISTSWLFKNADNEGALGDCSDEESVADRKSCLQNRYSLESKLKIHNDRTDSQGIYPLELIVNGYSGNKKYRNQSYNIPFVTAKNAYIVPKNYPLNDKSY